MKILDEIRKDAAGAAILSEWIGEGGLPVAAPLAESRASVCETCPKNKAPKWWEKAKDKIAETIKRHLEMKHWLNLKVPNEEKIHMCEACGCCLPLKVWVPLEHIVNHTSTAHFNEFHSACWIRKELSNP